MLIYSTSHFVLPLPPTHRFPMRKYALLHERVTAIAPECLRVPAAVTDAELANAHSTEYVAAVVDGLLPPSSLRRIGFPWSPSMVERSRRSAGATLGACRSALASGSGINLAGGTHHAYRDHGAGFCVFNDAAVAVRTLQSEGRIERALIVDLDVHQGDGSATIFADDPAVFTFSMHGRGNFPFIKAASSLDVELANGTTDREYMTILALALAHILSGPKPDLAIYLAGADPYAGDRLGRLSLSKRGLAARDRYVLETLRHHDVPVAVVMAGGYAEKVEDVVDIHSSTVEIALALFEPAFA
ncbi:MAG TPA: histone deacetylase [Casimicrobiaceae bacterium]|jgi:acetoin utilization deacetylase AcuC-like enzyme